MTDRLSPTDAAFLDLEDDQAPMHLAGMLLLDGPPLSFEEVHDTVAARLHLLPRFRQRLEFVPLGLGRPEWVDTESFRVADHLGHVVLPAPGGETQIKAHVDELASQPLDKTRPLWRIQLVDGLDSGGSAIALVLHHCMVDGLAIMNILGTLFSVDPGEADPVPPPAWHPRPAPSPTARLISTGVETARAPGQLLGAARGSLRQLPSRARRLTGFATSVGNAPQASLNTGRATRVRSTTWLELDLDEVKAVRRACDTTVNNVLLATVAGALRRSAERAGEPVEDLHAFVPVNVRADAAGGGLGNHISMTYPRLPVRVADPRARVVAVMEEIERIKRVDQAGASADLVAFSGLIPPQIAARVSRSMYFRGGLFNLTITNVPGPPIPVHFAGRRLVALRGAAPLTIQHALTIAFISYAGIVYVSITVDPARVPYGDAFTADLHAAFDELVAATA